MEDEERLARFVERIERATDARKESDLRETRTQDRPEQRSQKTN